MMETIEHFFWAMLWVFLILIVGFSILKWVAGMNGGIGNIADWIGRKADY